MGADPEEADRSLVGVFLLVGLSLTVKALSLGSEPNRTLESWTEILEQAVVPWWVGIAGAAPLVFLGPVPFLG